MNEQWCQEGIGQVQTTSAPLKSSLTRTNRWRDVWNIILISTRNRTLCLRQPSMPSHACHPLICWMLNGRWVIVWLREMLHAAIEYHRTLSITARQPYCSYCIKSSTSAGKSEMYHRTCGTPRSTPSTKRARK